MSKYYFALLVPARFCRRLTGQTVLTERRMQELELELEVEKYISEKVSSLVETQKLNYDKQISVETGEL